jgi:ribosomal protein S11
MGSLETKHFPDVQDYSTNHPELLKNIIRVVRGVMQGRTNNTGFVTLTASSGTSDVTLSSDELTPNALILFMPTTANAATEFAAGTMYVSEINAEASASGSGLAAYSFRITHVNNAQTDRTFRFVIIGDEDTST